MTLENVLKKVVQEISRDLSKKNITTKVVFIKYYADLLSLDPSWAIQKNILENRSEILRFVKYITNKLANQFDPDMITLKIQLFYQLNCIPREEIVRRARVNFKSKLSPLLKYLLKINFVPTTHSKPMSNFIKKLVYYFTLYSGMGNPTNEEVYKEVKTALKSAMNESLLAAIIGCEYADTKKEHLIEFVEIVAGIRLFNKNCGRAGETIDDMPKLLAKALRAMQRDVQNKLSDIMHKVNILTTILDVYYVPIPVHHKNTYELVLSNLPEHVNSNDIDRIKRILVMFRQQEIFVRQMMSKIFEVKSSSDVIKTKLSKMYDKIDETVQFKIAVPANLVFPLFQELAQVWFELQDESLLLNKYNYILHGMSIYTKQIAYPDYEHQEWIVQQLLEGKEVLTDADRIVKVRTDNVVAPEKETGFKMLSSDEILILDSIKFEFLGFCPWKLVETEGALIPGNPNLGCVTNNGKYYIFSDILAMNMFNKKPKRCIMRALELLRKKPEMIHFFDIKDQLILVKDQEELMAPEIVYVMDKFSVHCQTEVHPVPSRIVSNYKSNVWDLKREALLMANLSHCITSSTQTDECAGLAPVKTQTYNWKEQAVQTTTEDGTNVPQPRQYLHGLRGRTDDKQMQLDLTESIEKGL